MPKIPYGLLESQLPSTGGIRGGTLGIPAAQEPGVDPGTATLADRAISEFGQQTEKAGEFLVQAETYRAQSTRLQDVTDKTLAKQEALLRYQKAIAERNQGDYRTLPDDIVKIGKDLFEQVALERKLSPQAKVLFREDFGSAIVQAQQNALTLKTGRMQQDINYATSTAIYQAQQAAMGARDEDEFQLHMGELGSTLGQFVSTGGMHGDVAAKLRMETETAARFTRGELAVWKDPVAKFKELREINEGGAAMTPEFQNLPPQTLDKLLGKAATLVRENVAMEDHETRRQKALAEEQQEVTASTLRTKLMPILPTPQNMPQIQQLRQEIDQARANGQLGYTHHNVLSALAASYEESARKPPKLTDDPATESDLTNALIFASTPADFNRVRLGLAQRGDLLTPETRRQLAQVIEARSDRMHPLNRDGAKEGQRMIKEALVPGVAGNALMQRQLTETQRRELSQALTAFNGTLLGMEPRDVDMKWREVAENVIRDFMTQGAGLSGTMEQNLVKQLPLPLQKAFEDKQPPPNDWWAERTLQDNKYDYLSDAEKGRMLREYHTWSATPRGRAYLDKMYVNPVIAPPPPASKPGWGDWFKSWLPGGETTPPAPTTPTTPGMGSGPRVGAPIRTRVGS